MPFVRFNTVVLMLILVLISNRVKAQGFHYWDLQYSATATAMGGSTMSFVDDNSSVYYNPGSLAFIDPSSVSLSANAYRYDNYIVTNGAGKNVDLQSKGLSLFPSMIGGVIKFGEEKNHNWDFGYVLIQRFYEDVKINTRHTMEYDVIDSPDAPGLESYTGGFEYENKLSELWAGFAIAYKANDKLGIGLSTFGTYRDHNSNMNIYTRAAPKSTIDNNYNYASGNSYYDFTYQTVGLLWKLGLTYKLKKVNFGFTYTTPSINLTGSGDVQREISGTDINRDKYQNKGVYLGIDRQEGLNAEFKNPSSFSLGVSRKGNKSIISLAAEHFRPIGYYDVLSPDSNAFIKGDDADLYRDFNSIEFLGVKYEAKAITNVGVGYSYQISEKLNLQAGIRTDFSPAMKPQRNANIRIGGDYWQTFHFSAGFEVQRKESVFSLALDVGTGKSRNNRQFINFTDPKDTFFSPYYQIKMVGEEDESSSQSVTSFSLTLGIKQFISNEKDELPVK